MIKGVQNQQVATRRRRVKADVPFEESIKKPAAKIKQSKKVDEVKTTVKPGLARKRSTARPMKSTVKNVTKPSESTMGEYEAPEQSEIVSQNVTSHSVARTTGAVDERFAIWKQQCPMARVPLRSKLAKLTITDCYHDLDEDIAFNIDVISMFSDDDRGDLVPSVIRECVIRADSETESVQESNVQESDIQENMYADVVPAVVQKQTEVPVSESFDEFSMI